jgi:hypothetical protein
MGEISGNFVGIPERHKVLVVVSAHPPAKRIGEKIPPMTACVGIAMRQLCLKSQTPGNNSEIPINVLESAYKIHRRPSRAVKRVGELARLRQLLKIFHQTGEPPPMFHSFVKGMLLEFFDVPKKRHKSFVGISDEAELEAGLQLAWWQQPFGFGKMDVWFVGSPTIKKALAKTGVQPGNASRKEIQKSRPRSVAAQYLPHTGSRRLGYVDEEEFFLL